MLRLGANPHAMTFVGRSFLAAFKCLWSRNRIKTPVFPPKCVVFNHPVAILFISNKNMSVHRDDYVFGDHNFSMWCKPTDLFSLLAFSQTLNFINYANNIELPSNKLRLRLLTNNKQVHKLSFVK